MKRWLLGIALSLAAAGVMAQTIIDVDFVKQAMARGALIWERATKRRSPRATFPGQSMSATRR